MVTNSATGTADGETLLNKGRAMKTLEFLKSSSDRSPSEKKLIPHQWVRSLEWNQSIVFRLALLFFALRFQIQSLPCHLRAHL